MKTPLSMESPIKIESDPQQYQEEWFNIAVPNGKEFSLPNVSNPILDLPMTNFSLSANPQNALPCQLSHFPCNANSARPRPPKHLPIRKSTRALPNHSSLPNIPYDQIHGPIPIAPSAQTLVNGRLNTPLNISDNIFPVRNQEDFNYQANIPVAHMKLIEQKEDNNTFQGTPINNASGRSRPLQIRAPNLAPWSSSTTSTSSTTTPPLASGEGGRYIDSYALIPTLSLSSLLERQAKLENLNREFASRFNQLAAENNIFDLIAAPDLYRYNLARANSPHQLPPNFAGHDPPEEMMMDSNNIAKLFEAESSEAEEQAEMRQQQSPAACHYKCRECGTGFLSGHALGGHVSSHARKRKRSDL